MFIDNNIKENGFCPSFEEMKQAVGIKSKSGIYALIEELINREYIKKLPHKARALEVLRTPRFKPKAIVEEEKKLKTALQHSSAQIPLYGKIAAGVPIDAIANENEFVSVPFEMVAKGAYYALLVEGDSMIEAGILDGDTAIIKKTHTAENGQIVVALVEDSEATLKVWKKSKNEVCLEPCNKDYEVKRLHASQVKVQGVLSGIIRKYH